MASKLEIRAKALEATMEAWKDRPFKMPKRDCLKLMAFCLKKMGVKIPRIDKMIGYKTPLQARAALKRVYGVQTVQELLDKYFERINVAQCLPGDVIALPGSQDDLKLGAIGIYYGSNLMICYEGDHDRPVIGRLEPEGDVNLSDLPAWRTLP